LPNEPLGIVSAKTGEIGIKAKVKTAAKEMSFRIF